MKKTYFLTIVMMGFLVFAGRAYAATPSLSLSSNSDGDTVQVTVNGDANVGVIFYYTKANVGAQMAYLGTTNPSGYYSISISTSGYGIASNSTVYVTTNGVSGSKSNTITWPAVTASGNFYVNPTSVVLTTGQSSSVTAYNAGSSAVYLSNNSNPPVANINISGSQITVTALSYGSTVANICLQGNTATCASVYITVQNGNVQALNFSISNVTVSPGQSVPITISGGTGVYSVLNNSNSSVILSGISGSTITLSTTATSGSSAITVCSSDMSSCGIINATASSISTSPLVFSQPSPTISIGQYLTIALSGGSASTYYISANSNTATVNASVSGSNLMINGLANGLATITVCSSTGSCGSLPVTVSYTSNGGSLQLSQTTVSLLAGQVLSVTVSGGTSPYLLGSNPGNIFQASLNGNIITLSGISAGSSTINVCSSGGACLGLSVLVNSSGAGMPLTFSQSNVSLSIGGTTAVTISGSGGYYVSNSSNSTVASVQINSSVATVTGLVAGNSNISICQSGGQCAILSVSVSSGSSNASSPVLSQSSISISTGQVLNITVSGGSGGNYYISANSSPSVVGLSLSGNTLAVTGLAQGSSTVVVCAASNSCSVLTATVSGTSSTAVYFTSTSLPPGTTGQAYSQQLSAAGGTGNYSFALTSGALPAGLALSASGLVSGTPTATGSAKANITAKDSGGNSVALDFTIMINAPATLAAPVVSAGAYANGQLINENGTIYIVYQGTKVGFANAAAFLGLGFKFSNVIVAANSGLAVSPKVVITASGAHPRGTWILGGKTVYFVTPDGLIPVADWSTFLNNGGQAGFLVPANTRDLAMPMLSLMIQGDLRMK